jgi:transcriptional regulator with XRE-family HTH domain
MTDQDKEIGRRLAEARATLRFTQREMAEKLGMSLRTYGNSESGDRTIDVRDLITLATLGVKTSWLLTGRGAISAGVAEDAGPFEYHGIDGELMGRVTDAIVRLYRDENVKLPPLDQGRLAAVMYCEVELVSNPDARLGALEYLIEAKRRELRTAAAGDPSSKRRA